MDRLHFMNSIGLIYCKRSLDEAATIIDWHGPENDLEQAIGCSFWELLTVRDRLWYKEQLRQAIKRSESRLELYFQATVAQEKQLWMQEQLLINKKESYIKSILIPLDKKPKGAELFEGSRELLIQHNHYEVQTINPQFEEVMGWSQEEVVGQDLRELLVSKQQADLLNYLWRRLQKEESAEAFELELQKKNGEWGYFCLKAEAQYIYLLDKSKEKNCSLVLEEVQQRYNTFSVATEEGIVIHEEGIVLEMNSRAREISGIDEDEISGLPISALVHEDSVPQILTFLRENKQNGDIERQAIVKTRHKKSGQLMYVSVRGNQIKLDQKSYRYVIIRDITKEHLSEQMLKASEQRYKRLSDATKELILIHEDGIIREVNRAFCEFTGFSESELIGAETFDLMATFNFQNRQFSRREVRQFYESDKEIAGRSLMTKKDSSKFMVDFEERIMYNKEQKLRYVIIRDITQAEEAKQALEESRNKYKNLADASFEGVMILEKSVIREVNRAFCSMLGYEEKEVIGKNIQLLFNDKEQLPMLQQQAQEQAIFRQDVVLQHKNEQLFPAQLHHRKLDDSDLCYLLIRNMSESLENQRLLQESTEKYKRLSNASREAVIIYKDGQIQEVNHAACSLFGWNEQELTGRNIRKIAQLGGRSLQAALEQSDTVKLDRIPLYRSDGSSFMAEVWESGTQGVLRPGLRYLIIRDISDRIRYEQRIEELYYDLSESNEQLRCILDLSRLAAHEFANLEELIEKALKLIPPSWQFPELCQAQIQLGNKKWQTDGFPEESIYQLSASIPLKNGEKGILRLAYKENQLKNQGADPFLKTELQLIEAVAAQIAFLIEKKQSEEETVAAILATEDRERARIAKELHDSLGQLLMAISLNLEGLKKDRDKLAERNQQKLDKALQFLQDAITEGRNISHNLMPKAINDYGYVLAVQSMLEGYQKLEHIEFIFYDNLDNKRLPQKVELALFRITQEAITNILKHAQAQQVSIQLMHYPDVIMLIIEDDGKGFDAQEKLGKQQFGLNSMRNRSNSISGTLTIESRPQQGTVIMVEIPL